METGFLCPAGKDSWPELVGKSVCEAKETIESENGNVTVEILYKYSPVPAGYRCDRVFVWVDVRGQVVRVPKTG